MNGKDLIKTAIEELPEFKDEYEKQLAEGYIDTEAGLYIVFEYVLDPLVIEAVKSKDSEKCRRFFDFIERMAESDDDEVIGVTDFAIMERLRDEFEESELVPHLGEHSMESYNQVGTYMY